MSSSFNLLNWGTTHVTSEQHKFPVSDKIIVPKHRYNRLHIHACTLISYLEISPRYLSWIENWWIPSRSQLIYLTNDGLIFCVGISMSISLGEPRGKSLWFIQLVKMYEHAAGMLEYFYEMQTGYSNDGWNANYVKLPNCVWNYHNIPSIFRVGLYISTCNKIVNCIELNNKQYNIESVLFHNKLVKLHLG